MIPVRNGAHFLVKAIDSVAKQTHPINKIIVVNDGSTDETSLILDSLLSEYRNLCVIETEHRGLSAARNIGWRASQADYISFLDVDDFWSRHKIENQVQHLKAHLNCKIAFSNTILINDSNSNKVKLRGSTKFPASPLNILRRRFIVAGSASSVILRKSLLYRVNGFDETLSYGEDLDLWIRISVVTEICCVDDFDVFVLKTSGSMQSNVIDIEKVFKHNILILKMINRYVSQHEIIKLKNELRAAFWGDLKKNIRHGIRDLLKIYSKLRLDFPDLVQALFPTSTLFLLYFLWACFSKACLRLLGVRNG